MPTVSSLYINLCYIRYFGLFSFCLPLWWIISYVFYTFLKLFWFAYLFLGPFAWIWWNQETYDLQRFKLSFNGQWIEAVSLDQARNNFNRIRNFFIKMPLLFNSDSNFWLKYFGLKFFLLAAKFTFILSLINKIFCFTFLIRPLQEPKWKGGGLLGISPLYQRQSGHSWIFTARWIYTVCYLSVMTQCQYFGCVIISEGFMVFTIFLKVNWLIPLKLALY